jgi:hypothetical protein
MRGRCDCLTAYSGQSLFYTLCIREDETGKIPARHGRVLSLDSFPLPAGAPLRSHLLAASTIPTRPQCELLRREPADNAESAPLNASFLPGAPCRLDAAYRRTALVMWTGA